MTPPPDLAKCSNCDGWFAAAATDEVFHHASARCCRRESAHRPQEAAEPWLGLQGRRSR